MNFGDIRRILDKYTTECNDCPYKDREEEPDEDGIVPYESCNLDCSTYYAKQIKNEIMSLVDDIKIPLLPNFRPTIKYKGSVVELPSRAQDGDCYYVTLCEKNFIWLHNTWNELGDVLI